MICNESISKMKLGVMLINTSRGALINTKDVIVVFTNRQIGYLGIDVFFFKQKTAYEIMSGDWSSDVCSSD
eukprot:COSAG01_NODE_61763_length_288_cov_0.492063_1_plen_70_part_10